MTDYGGASSVICSAATVALVLPKRMGRRHALSVANVGSNPVYVDMSDQEVAVASSGIYLAPGGVLTDSDSNFSRCWQGSISAISTLGSTLAVWERVGL